MAPVSTAPATTGIDAVKRFYNRFGAMQDWQRFYEDAAVDAMIAHADLGHARAVLEIGCGTGRLAEFLLAHRLLTTTTYLGLDVSDTMIALASRRLRPYGQRARVQLTRGEIPGGVAAASADRVLAAYVFDLLDDDALAAVLRQAHRALAGGLLATVSIADGTGPVSRAIMRAWSWLHGVAPVLTGYCRPRQMTRWLTSPQWEIVWHGATTRFGITSDVVVARAVREGSCGS